MLTSSPTRCAISVVVAVLIIGRVQSGDSGSGQLQEANRLFEARDYEAAVRLYGKILDGSTDAALKAKAEYNKGLALVELGQTRRAIRTFKRMLGTTAHDTEPGGHLMEAYRNYRHRACRQIASCYESRGDLRRALDYAILAKYRYPYQSWCGTCAVSAMEQLNDYIFELATAQNDRLIVSRIGYEQKAGIEAVREPAFFRPKPSKSLPLAALTGTLGWTLGSLRRRRE